MPTTVVRDHAARKINEIENEQIRKLNSKEKTAIREESYGTLLPQAFSKYKKIYAIIDPTEKIIIN